VPFIDTPEVLKWIIDGHGFFPSASASTGLRCDSQYIHSVNDPIAYVIYNFCSKRADKADTARRSRATEIEIEIEGQRLTSGFGLDRGDTHAQVEPVPHLHYNYQRINVLFMAPGCLEEPCSGCRAPTRPRLTQWIPDT
jgi:hypothetical protein